MNSIMFLPIPINMNMSGSSDTVSLIFSLILLGIMLFFAVYIIMDYINLCKISHMHKNSGGGSCSFTVFFKDGKMIKEGIDKI